MSDRADITAAALAVIGFSLASAYAALSPGAVTSGSPDTTMYLLLTIPIFTYAVYWSLSLRHALAVHMYRRQALGIGIVVLTIWITIGAFVVVPPTATGSVSQSVQFLAFDSLFIVLFYWIDASVLTARRSDPLLRDTLHWSRIRIPLWIAVIVTTLVPLLLLGYIGVASDTTMYDQLNAGTLGGPVVSLLLDVAVNFDLVIPICGMVYLPAIALRSKWDRSLRRHFIWFVPASVGLLLIFYGPNTGSSSFASLLLSGLVLVGIGYSLYRSARALVPLNRVSLSAPE